MQRTYLYRINGPDGREHCARTFPGAVACFRHYYGHRSVYYTIEADGAEETVFRFHAEDPRPRTYLGGHHGNDAGHLLGGPGS